MIAGCKVTVVKLGGSLFRSDQLDAWLATIVGAGAGKLVLVPGGGPFADTVREAQAHWSFDDATAHHLAILAMEQYGRMLAGIEPALIPASSGDEIESALGQGCVPVWMPSRMCIGRPEIPESWEVTSDSLALWLADQIGASRVILIKATAPPEGAVPCAALAESGLLDLAFGSFLARSRTKAYCLGPGREDALAELLAGRSAGTCEVVQDDAG